jgi:phage terminase small subunit
MEQTQLTDRQKVFINRYYKHRNATRACIESGYSEKTATQYSYTLLHKPHVRAVIEAMLKDVGQELDR